MLWYNLYKYPENPLNVVGLFFYYFKWCLTTFALVAGCVFFWAIIGIVLAEISYPPVGVFVFILGMLITLISGVLTIASIEDEQLSGRYKD